VAHWTCRVLSADGIRRGDVPLKSFSLDFPIDGPCTATASLDGLAPIAEWVQPLTHDLLFIRDEVPMFRGRIAGEPSDEITEAGHTMAVPVVDYRGLLERRTVWPGSSTTYAGVDQAAIAWDLIRDSQALPGGNWGISQGIGSLTGVTRDREYPEGKKIGEAITELGRVLNGFEWEIDPLLALNIYYPQRGQEQSFRAVWGTNVERVSRTASTADYGNAYRYSGDDSLTPITRVAADIASRVEGRFETALGDADISQATTLAERADGALGDGQTLLPGYVVTLRPGYWPGKGQLWLGDQIRLVLQSGYLDLDVDIRVVGIAIAVDENNDETITLTLGRPSRQWLEFWRESMRRLDRLERR
jgi:hypothetical protein